MSTRVSYWQSATSPRNWSISLHEIVDELGNAVSSTTRRSSYLTSLGSSHVVEVGIALDASRCSAQVEPLRAHHYVVVRQRTPDVVDKE